MLSTLRSYLFKEEKRVWRIFLVMMTIDVLIIILWGLYDQSHLQTDMIKLSHEILGGWWLTVMILITIYLVFGFFFSWWMTDDERFMFGPMIPPGAYLLMGHVPIAMVVGVHWYLM